MYPYNTIGLVATIAFFLFFLVFFPVLTVADKWHYCNNAYSSKIDNDSSSTSGVRVFNLDLSEFTIKSHPRRHFIFYKSLNCRKFLYV